ncbi:MAG: DegT/DnrJ/EryC1/StrS family aminotransferase [Planctomycetes bacterium]|nr:DegT/DnrJ/EryC1/StrS family aminotransferase [Planctomycetota bacterium]
MIPRFKPRLGWEEFKALFRRNSGAVEEFENRFAEEFHGAAAVSFPYGRSALWAFFKALEINEAEVVMPAYSCNVVAHAIVLSGNIPRFIDIGGSDYNFDLERLPTAINENTRAVIATHIFGYPMDLDRLESIVAEAEDRIGHKIWLIQDCAHSFEASWKGRPVTTSGDAALFGLNIGKMITSIYGGMMTFKDSNVARKVMEWRNQNFRKPSRTKAIKRRIFLICTYLAFSRALYWLVWLLSEKTKLLHSISDAYHLDGKIHFPPDFQDLMLKVEAAVGLKQLDKYREIVEDRRANASWYFEHLAGYDDFVIPPKVEGATYSQFVLRSKDRKKIMTSAARKSVQLGMILEYSIPHLACYERFKDGEHPNSLATSLESINLPVYFERGRLRERNLLRVLRALQRCNTTTSEK